MNLLKQLTLKSIFLVLLFASTFGSQVLAQCTGQKFRTIRHGATLLPGSTATTLIYGGSQPAMGCVTTTKTDIVSSLGGSLQYNYASGSYANNLGSGAPASLIEAANDGGGTRITMYNGNETDLVYNFAAPVTNPILFVGGIGTIGLYTGASIEVVGKTVTKLGGDPNFNVTGSTITNNGANVLLLQRGYVQIIGEMSTFTLKLKSTTAFYGYQWFDLHVGACYSAPPVGTPCPGKELWTATHSAITPAKSHAQMKNGNSVVIDRVDVVGASLMAGSSIGGDTYANGVTQCFPNGGDYVKGGGYINLTTAVGGTTELTYTFCNPVTDPFVFFGWAGISAGGEVAFDKPIDIMDAEDGFAKVAAQSVGVCGSDLYQNGYVKVQGTFTTFKMTFKSGPTWNQVFTMMVGECTDVTPKVAAPQPACVATATQKYVNFTYTDAATSNPGFLNAYKTVGTSAEFVLMDDANAVLTNEIGSAVKAKITTAAAATVCGPFSTNALSFLLGQDNVQGVVAAGDGYSYKYKFNAPVKIQVSNEVANSYALAYSEFVIIEAKKGGVAVNVSGVISGGALGLMTAVPGNPNAVMFQGGFAGNLWKAWPAGEVDEITFTYKSNNNDAYVQEPHRIAICSAPCAITYPACAAANQRTEAFGFTRASATTATGAKGANTLTMTTTAGVPILAAAGSGASTMNECGDANKQMSVSSGGWALLGAKANKTGEKITINFASPVTNPIILVWNIYYSTQLDINGVSTCLKPVRSWYGATAGPGITNTGDLSSITGTFLGLGGIGYYQVPGTYTELTFDVKTGIWENWFYMSIGEGVCSPAPEVINTSAPRALTCTSPTGNLRTYDANFDTNVSAWKTVTGKAYSAIPTLAMPTPGYVNDLTVDCNTNNAYWFGLYGYTSYPAGQVPASSGCTPSTADFASAGGGAVYAYSGAGVQGAAPWATAGNMKWTLKNEVVNPIIKVKYLSWTKLTFKDCDGNVIPMATIPGTFKYGLTSSGSSLFNSPVPTNIYANQIPNEWSDGIEGEGAVQLIGRFKEINVSIEKTAYWGDYWSMTLSEQVCTSNAPVTVSCTEVIPSCPMGGKATTVAAGFTKSAVNGAVGSLTTGGKPVVTTLVSTSEVLLANTDRAAGTFADATCYSVAPVGGGAVTIKDIGGNNTTTISFGRSVVNPLIYVKDLTRLQLDFGSTLDINGSAVCCMKLISAGNGLVTTGATRIADNNPTQNGSPTEKLTPGCGLVQLVGTFNNIVINSSRPSGDTRFNDWTITIGGEAVCLPDAVLASLGAAPQDPANPGIAPATVVSPASLANPVALKAAKTLTNVVPKNPAQPDGNQIVSFEIEIRNETATKVTGLYLEDKLDEKFAPGVIVAIAAAPRVIWPHYAIQQGNPSFNGVTNLDLIKTDGTNMLAAGEVIRVTYSVEINPKLIPASAGRVTNSVKMGSTTMAVTGAAEASMYLPSAVMLPTNQESGICSGKGGVEFAKFLQCVGGAKVMPNAACGKIKWGWSWEHDYSQPHCGNAETKKVLFAGFDECGNNYKYEVTFTTRDDCPPTLDMLPMDKTVNCGDAAATTSIDMWLNKAGGAWVSDPGQEPGSVTSSHDYKQTGCNPGVYTVSFTFTDACGKSISAPAKLTLLAKTGTSASLKMNNTIANKVINCSDVMKFDAPEMETTCPDGEIKVTFKDEDVAGTCAMEHEVLRTWIYTDNCGNEYVAKQTIKLTDNVAPQFDATLPTSFNMNKGLFKVWQKIFFAQVKATDNCSAATLSTPTYTVISEKQVECKVIATDGCGNSTTYQCIVTFNDIKKKIVLKEAAVNNTTAEAIIKDLEVYIASASTEEVPTEAVIYPNPTEQMVNIIPAQGHGDIQKVHVYNMDGRVLSNLDVEGMQNQTISIDISNFPSGTYIIEMKHTEKNVFSKVQKIK